MSPQSELLMLIGMYTFIGLYLISLLKNKSFKIQVTYLVAGVLGYLLVKDIIIIPQDVQIWFSNLLTEALGYLPVKDTTIIPQDVQFWLSTTYLSLGFVGILHYFATRKVNIKLKRERLRAVDDFKQQVSLPIPSDINLNTQLSLKQDKALDTRIEEINNALNSIVRGKPQMRYRDIKTGRFIRKPE